MKAIKKTKWIGWGIFTLIALVTVPVFFKFLYEDSALYWTMEQDPYYDALQEIGILAGELFCSLCFPPKRWMRLLLTTVCLLWFSYVHVFFFPFLVGILYACMLWMTGRLCCKLFAKKYQENWFANLLMGMAGIIVLVAVCSVFKMGTPKKLRWIYVAVFLLETVLLHHDIIKQIRIFFQEKEELSSVKKRILSALLLAVSVSAFMIQIGRANIALDYDSLWYGVRSNDILAPYTGIYDQLMTTGCVYVYSKAIETLSLAFSCQSTYSFVYAVNLMFTAMTLYGVYALVRLFGGRNKALFAVLCCSVTAGIMNMGSTAKSDISTLFVQVIMVYFALHSVKEKDGTALALAIAAGIFSFVFKPTSIVFSGIVLAVILLTAFCYKIKPRLRDWLALIPPLAAVLFLLARSYCLTGVPLSLFGQSLWKMLGFEYQYPYAVRETMSASLGEVLTTPLLWERLERLVQTLFYPNTEATDHVIIAWGGMLFSVVWLGIIVLVFSHPIRTWKRIKENPTYAFSLITLATISAASVGSLLLLDKPDGNYFMLMYLLTFVHGSLELEYFPRTLGFCYSVAVIPLVVCGVMMCLASHWSWALGFTPTPDKNRGIYFHIEDNWRYYEQLQINELCEELQSKKKAPRTMIFSSEIPRLLDIPAAADSWLDLVYWGNSDLAKTSDALYEYYKVADMEYLLVQGSYLANEDLARTNLIHLAEDGYLSLERVQGDFCLLSFHSSAGEWDGALCGWLKGLAPR